MKGDSDILYMEQFRDGDQDAFRILFLRYKKKMINFCYRFCADREIAEELAQEVFLRVYKAAPGYRPKARFSTWIFRIATNVCLNDRRKKKGVKFESLDNPFRTRRENGPVDIEDHRMPAPQAQLEYQERDRFIQKALLNLPKKQRAALLLRLYYGFSYREIGEQMNASESSVKSLIHRGRQNLKQHLGAYFKGE